MEQVSDIHEDILNRLDGILSQYALDYCKDSEGLFDSHLRWMLKEIKEGRIVGSAAHRWLGYVQGMMVARRYTTLENERNLTRDYFKG